MYLRFKLWWCNKNNESICAKEILPEEKNYVEVLEDEDGKVQKVFAELSEVLLGNDKHTKQFLKKVKPEKMQDMEDAWLELYEELLGRGRAIELDWKIRKDDFIRAKELAKEILQRIAVIEEM